MEIAQEFEMAVEHQPRRRTHISGVQVDEPVSERELALDHLPVAFIRGFRRAGRRGIQCGFKSSPGYWQCSHAEKVASAIGHGGPPRVDSLYSAR